ncbi:MAG: hypothetical protein ACFHWZ_00990 [Phycisphaerales bacterium]
MEHSRGVRLALLVPTASTALADARAWVSGSAEAADLVLTLRSVDEADASLRSLSRTAEIDWLPPASRLLEATSLSAGVDTSRPLVIAMLPGAGEEAIPRIVTILPTTSSDALLQAFDAQVLPDSPGLHGFTFAGRPYHARVLPDDHFAISADAGALRPGDRRLRIPSRRTDPPRTPRIRLARLVERPASASRSGRTADGTVRAAGRRCRASGH